MHRLRTKLLLACVLCVAALRGVARGADIPANTWVRIADCPGDAEGREIPPGRAATWCYEPVKKVFLRYGGYTPRFSNALDQFDPATGKWKRLFAEDENYPDDRPGGGCSWDIRYDEKSKRVLLAGGLACGFTGSTGIWSYDPAGNNFKPISKELPKNLGKVCVDPVHGIAVAAPWPASTGLGAVTMVCNLTDGKWETVNTPQGPQPAWGGHILSMTFDAGLGRVISIDGDFDKSKSMLAYSFDPEAKKWEKLMTTGASPSVRMRSVIAYDPDNKVVILHGLSAGDKGPNADQLNDTWVFDTAKKEWKEIKTPGPTPMKSADPPTVMCYRQALAYDTDRKRFLLADADLGVWAFRYDPAAEPGKECIANGFVPTVGKAASNPPAEGAADSLKEIRQTLPSPLNPHLTEMGDNTLIPLGGGVMLGAEVPWCYDPELGVFAKYGGCGNGVSPYWSGYGNNLSLYDPGHERWLVRRVCDVAGALRPRTACSRSIFHDSSRKLLWFMGGAGSGPACPMPGYTDGSFTYDSRADKFTLVPGGGTFPGHNTGLEEDPDHLVAAVTVDKDKTHVFDIKAQAWNVKDTPGAPGGPEYRHMPYITTKKFFLALSSVTDKEDTPNRTMSFDPATNTWTDLKAQGQPPTRNHKYGLVYDSKNDVAILLGGGTHWNGGNPNDMWAYIVKENRWEKITPKLPADFKMPPLTDNMPSGYDVRHNAIIFLENNVPYAYRYKK